GLRAPLLLRARTLRLLRWTGLLRPALSPLAPLSSLVSRLGSPEDTIHDTCRQWARTSSGPSAARPTNGNTLICADRAIRRVLIVLSSPDLYPHLTNETIGKGWGRV